MSVWPAGMIHWPGPLNSTPWENPLGFDHSAGCKVRMSSFTPFLIAVIDE